MAGTLEKVDKNEVLVEEDTNDIIFSVESWGQLSCSEIMMQAADELESQLKDFEAILKDS